MLLGKRLYSLLMFVILSILSGVLVAGLLMPAVGIVADSGRTAVSGVNDLPTELKQEPQWERSKLLDGNDKVLAYFYDQNRVYVPLSQISDIMKKAQVGIEDHRFYEHGAMDLTGTARALVSTSQGNTQGGSSLTQQYVRMMLVEKAMNANDEAAALAAKENSVARKIRELRYAIAVEKEFTKDQILEFYLNMAYYGDGAYGVEAAAKHYFGVSAANLNLPQAAMLAGLVRNPNATNPVSFETIGVGRRNDVIDRLAELKIVTPDEAAAAKATTFDRSKITNAPVGCANSEFPFVCEYALQTLINKTPALGATKKERLQRVYRGGFTIRTQIDPSAQRVAEKAISKWISAKDPVVSVVTMMEPSTGLIRAMAQNRQQMGKKAGQTYWNYAVGADLGGADGYQGGSTFKIFVAAAALENGFGVNTSFNVQGVRDYFGEVFPTCGGTSTVTTHWKVVNPESGYYNMLRGTAQSVNNYFVPLEQAVGLCPTVNMAKRVGLQLASGKDLMTEAYPSFTLGAAEITPLSMVSAYGTFANRGVRCDPVILKSVTSKDGASIPIPESSCTRVLKAEYADAVNKVFQGPFTSGTLTGSRIWGYDLAGKTGTVPGNKAAWTVGYTPDLVTAAMVSYDNNPHFAKYWAKHRQFIGGIQLPVSKSRITGYGSDIGRKIFRPAMKKALDDLDKHTKFVEPPASVMGGDSITVPSCSGIGPSACAARLSAAGFSVYKKQVYSDTVPVGGLVGTTDSGQAPKGSQIGVLYSKGPQPTKTPTTPTPPAATPPVKKR
jgi:membrane peptidoglycan carboxypeptidase